MSQLDTLPEELQRVLITGYKVTLAAFKVVLCESEFHIEPKEHSAEHWYTQALDEIGGIFVEELKPHVPGISWRKTETSEGDLIGAVIFCTQMADDGQIRTVVEYVLPAAFLTPEIRTAFSKAGSRGVRCLSAVEGSTIFKRLVRGAKP